MAAPATIVGPELHTRRHIAERLLPLLFLLYVANYIDRSNIAYAALEMSHDLGFNDRVFGIGAGIFFLGYVALQIPGALGVERWSARRLIAIIMVTWGLLSALTGLIQNSTQLYVARALLGAAEAGFFPGVIVYLTHWFIYEDRAKATANFMAAIPISFAIGSPIAGVLLSTHWLGLAGWRWLFLMEGLPAALLGIAAYFYLPDRPRDARWLSTHERQWIEGALEQERKTKSGSAPASIGKALRYRPVLLLALTTLFVYSGAYGFMFWFPTILKDLSGFSNLKTALVGMLPYLTAFIAMQLIGWNSDRTGERRWHTAFPLFLGAAAFLCLLAFHPGTWVSVALFAVIGMYLSYLCPLFALSSALLRDSASAAAIGFINAVGSIGGFVGPVLIGYLHRRTGSFSLSLTLMMLTMAAGAVTVLLCPDPRREHVEH